MKDKLIEKYFEKDYPEDASIQFVGNLYDVYEKAFNTALKIGFNQGYMCATATIVKAHGEDSLAEELLRCNFNIDEIDEYDLKILEPIIKEVERKRALEGN